MVEPLGGADGDGPQLAVSDLAEHGGRVLELHLDAARHEVDQRRPGAAIRNMGEIDAGERPEQPAARKAKDPMPAEP